MLLLEATRILLTPIYGLILGNAYLPTAAFILDSTTYTMLTPSCVKPATRILLTSTYAFLVGYVPIVPTLIRAFLLG